ncbi:hypothetical protein CR513_04110, partial [Mucuna pruriens]
MFIYGWQGGIRKQQVYEDLRDIFNDVECASTITRDFNSIMTMEERGGELSSLSTRDVIQFNNFVQDCELIDACFEGPPLLSSRSRSKWLAYGDRNIKYFLDKTLIRSNKNTYESLQRDYGTWEDLEELVTIFYKNLFMKEIVVENSLAKLLMEIFANPSKVEEINGSLNTLIPKIDKVHNIKNFRSINLYNMAYKTMIKILTQRLRHKRPMIVVLVFCAENLGEYKYATKKY